ncbi:hypothetical protein EDB80DRAFT_677509 [Ilyonectria destructans]|nr:hypothetical protein EDB80DRAFT_677509 [Ilyonectria destructans]
MTRVMELFVWSAVLAIANARGVIIGAQGEAGPPSLGFRVNPEIARNCTTISPCQQDATLIRTAEIEANIVDECGRTERTGNIDIGEETENALAAGAVTQVTKGSSIEVTVHQVNADGAGPYYCLWLLRTTFLVSMDFPQDFNITVLLPKDLAGIEASTGNVCTVRCRNAALVGSFGGCFPTQQTDIKLTVNDPATISSAQDIDLTLAQVAAN